MHSQDAVSMSYSFAMSTEIMSILNLCLINHHCSIRNKLVELMRFQRKSCIFRCIMGQSLLFCLINIHKLILIILDLHIGTFLNNPSTWRLFDLQLSLFPTVFISIYRCFQPSSSIPSSFMTCMTYRGYCFYTCSTWLWYQRIWDISEYKMKSLRNHCDSIR